MRWSARLPHRDWESHGKTERRRVALRNYHDKAGRIVHEGSIWDATDDFVQGNPEMFGPEAA